MRDFFHLLAIIVAGVVLGAGVIIAGGTMFSKPTNSTALAEPEAEPKQFKLDCLLYENGTITCERDPYYHFEPEKGYKIVMPKPEGN